MNGWLVTAIFQSTPSARRATKVCLAENRSLKISIHALREESDAIIGEVEL